MDQPFPVPDQSCEPARRPVEAGGQGLIRLVGARELALDLADAAAPDEWREALAALATSHRIALAPAPRPSAGSGLRQVARWAAGAGAPEPAALRFAPWQAFAPATLQNPLARAGLPQAGWLASYLFDPAAARSGAASGLDIMLASPHPAACLEDETCHTALPRKAVFDAMLAAVRAEQRERLVIIVPARARSAMAQRMLLADRALTRGDIAIEILAIEEAIARLVRSARSWDAIIVLPELRGVIAAVLAEIGGCAGPWPLLWHEGERAVYIAAEALRERPAPLPLDAAVLMQGLALAARAGGLPFAAEQIATSWVRLRDSGVGTATRPSPLPYGHELDDAAFLALAGAEQGPAAGRLLPQWKALATLQGNPRGNKPLHSPVALSLVRS